MLFAFNEKQIAADFGDITAVVANRICTRYVSYIYCLLMRPDLVKMRYEQSISLIGYKLQKIGHNFFILLHYYLYFYYYGFKNNLPIMGLKQKVSLKHKREKKVISFYLYVYDFRFVRKCYK